jgi:hypothetical protein
MVGMCAEGFRAMLDNTIPTSPGRTSCHPRRRLGAVRPVLRIPRTASGARPIFPVKPRCAEATGIRPAELTANHELLLIVPPVLILQGGRRQWNSRRPQPPSQVRKSSHCKLIRRRPVRPSISGAWWLSKSDEGLGSIPAAASFVQELVKVGSDDLLERASGRHCDGRK